MQMQNRLVQPEPNPLRRKQLERLVQKLGLTDLRVVNWSLLDLALTHPSADPECNYEHLEFVGDAVLRLVSAQLLTEIYGDLPVGELAAIRSILVSDRTLAEIAQVYSLDRYLIKSSSAEGDRTGLNSRLADALEAVLGALYFSDPSLVLVRSWLDTHLQPLAETIRQDPARQNYKAAFQEWTQHHYQQLPTYETQETDPIHNSAKRFTAQIWFQGKCWGQGQGRSMKAAEQAAAKVAFAKIEENTV